MHTEHDHMGTEHTHEYTHSHSHEHDHDQGHTHDHVHTYTHTHEDGGAPHTHEVHEHTHEHGHEHGHSHCDSDCASCGGCHTPMEELTALMKYMVGHNTSHANELAQLAKQLDEAGEHAAYEQVMQAVSDFEKGNLRLSTVLAALAK